MNNQVTVAEQLRNEVTGNGPEGSSKSGQPSIVIVGAGVSGICMAIQLKRAGYRSVTILEKSNDFGGTWLENSYPGCGCDVPAMLYSFSFALKSNWSRLYALQPELLEYFKETAHRFDLSSITRFGETVQEARFDETSGLWNIELESGETLTANIFISSVGQLNRPSIPNLPGADQFEGPQFHSARWNHDFDFQDKKVAVIGNGASAIQLIPEISKVTKQTYIFQRSANYIAPRNDHTYSGLKTACFRWIPGYARLYRSWLFWRHEYRIKLYRRNSVLNKNFRHWLLKKMRERTPKKLWRTVIPKYPAGCKRVLLSDDYLQCLGRENVEVVDQGVTSLTADGVIAGEEQYPVDAVVYATGFKSTEFLSPMKVIGRNDLDINTAWQARPKTWYGVMVHGFPNFFMLYGPNTNLGHNSIIFMIECQVKLIMNSLKLMQKKQAGTIEVTESAVDQFDQKLQSDLGKLVWNEDCGNWYTNQTGNIVNNWSGAPIRYWWETRSVNDKAFELK